MAPDGSQPVSLMQEMLEQAPTPPQPGDIIEGKVLALDRARLYIDLPPFGTGVIYGREYLNAREVIKRTNVGDVVAAKVISTDTKDGYIELSLKEARQAIIWAEAEEAVKQKAQFELDGQRGQQRRAHFGVARNRRISPRFTAQSRALPARYRRR